MCSIAVDALRWTQPVHRPGRSEGTANAQRKTHPAAFQAPVTAPTVRIVCRSSPSFVSPLIEIAASPIPGTYSMLN